MFKKTSEATMNTVGIYLLYLLISIGLTIAVGTGVARSGRAFLLDVVGGNDTLARAISRLIVLGFYLLSLGFVVLTMHAGGTVTSATAGLQLLSVKVGEVLLMLGLLHLLTLGALVRARRLAQARQGQQPARSDQLWNPGPRAGDRPVTVTHTDATRGEAADENAGELAGSALQ
jgi:hypothetical protein